MVDAITVQVVRNRISSVMQEMHYHFYRSGYSTIIRELRDFSCVILDRNGGLLVAPPMFFHAPVYRHLVGRILELYGDSIVDGDLFVSNHPYEGGLPHVSDMAFVAPIFSQGMLVGFSGSVAHKADVGGTMPGSTSANATELFHEGLLLAADPDRGGGSIQCRSGAAHPRQQPPAGTGARRHARADGRNAHGRRRACSELGERFGAMTVAERFRGDPVGCRQGIARRHRRAAGRGILWREFHGFRRHRA